MAAKKKTENNANSNKGYQPKATARHAKIVRTKEEEIEAFRKKIDTDKYLAKKYESNRRTEIKALPKEERSAAKAELRDAISKRKDAERKDKAKLRDMIRDEKATKGGIEKEPFDEDAWINDGKKNRKKEPAAEPAMEKPAEDPILPDEEEIDDSAEEPADEPAPESDEEKKKD